MPRSENYSTDSVQSFKSNFREHLTSLGITVLARGGVVTLDGTVPTDDQIQIAADVASNVSGVHAVTNNLLMQEEGH